jgi:hypothetical protein
LYTILDDAQLNIINIGNPVSIIDQLSTVTESFQDTEKLISKNIPLGKYYRYSLSHDLLEKSRQSLENAQNWFPKSIKPFVLFSAISTEITVNTFTTKKYCGKPFSVNNNISLPSSWIGIKKSAPYFILTAALLNNGQVNLHEAFAIPILGTSSLMPVESNYERTVLKIILSVCKENKDIRVEKPLFDLIEEDFRFRPDFIIYCGQKRKIFVEVLGSNDTEYLCHKEYIARHANKYCYKYISIKAFNVSKGYGVDKEYVNFVQNIRIAISSC